MRNLKNLTVILVIAFSFTACTNKEISPLSIAEAESIIPGTYKVNAVGDTYGDVGQFGEYTFDFFSNGALTATKGAESYSGVWVIKPISDIAYDKEVSITITGNPEMDYLTHDWMVIEVTDVTLQLVDKVGIEEIHFIKI